MSEVSNREISLVVGELIIGLICPSEEFAQQMKEYFGINHTIDNADIRFNLNLVPHRKRLIIPDSIFKTKVIDDDKFIIGNNLVTGYIDQEQKKGELWVKTDLTKGRIRRVFEQVLYQAYYSVSKMKCPDSFLVHSSGVIYKDKGFLFVGPSGSGKSTVASLSKDYHVINDEICLISLRNGKAMLYSTPFNGLFKEKSDGSAELVSIFFLEHGKTHKLVELEKISAIKTLAKEIVPPIALNELLTSKTFLEMIDMATRLYQIVQMKKLLFLPDNGFWKEIDANLF